MQLTGTDRMDPHTQQVCLKPKPKLLPKLLKLPWNAKNPKIIFEGDSQEMVFALRGYAQAKD